MVASGVKVITSRNPVSSALFLVLTFFNAAAIWLLLEAEFLAILLVLIYVGAVMVLFLFVVMMLDVNLNMFRYNFRRFVPIATIIGTIIVIEVTPILWYGYSTNVSLINEGSAQILQATRAANSTLSSLSNTRLIGRMIYSDYIFAFEVAGFVLLVAIVAAIALTIRDSKDAKHQRVSRQIKARREDRVRLIQITTEK
ncbi:NADH-quinone oxidoreductase subunit J [Candidatus Vallotia cooleyia]|nr:NADH-quinone oxidoreductase subunit J [Candidatus Vallotia cooleyia]